jgi:hypothetical protein
MNLSTWIAVGRLVIFMAFGLRDLVLEAANNPAVEGSKKFQAVKDAIVTVARMMGIAEKALSAADKIINEKIESTYQSAKADGAIEAITNQDAG